MQLHMPVLVSGQGCCDMTVHSCHATGHDGRCAYHVDHESDGFAWVLGIGVVGAEVEEAGSSSVGNGLAQAGFACLRSPIQQH